MGKLNAYMGLFGLVTVSLLVYFMFFNGGRNTSSVSNKAEASFLGRKRRK